MANGVNCPYCNSEGVLKYGKYKGVQRYWCKICRRKFKADDTLFHGKTPAGQIATVLEMYYEGMSIQAGRRHLEQEYGNIPSTSTIYGWILKYTRYFTDSIKDYKPKVGDTWVADESIMEIDGKSVWLWDIIDEKTCFLLASYVSRNRSVQEAQLILKHACEIAGDTPKTIITDKLYSCFEGVKTVFKGEYGEREDGHFNIGNNPNLIENCHSILKDRTKVLQGLKNLETVNQFVLGWLAYYNFIRPHRSLKDRTPAEAAGIEYPYKNWSQIIRYYTPAKPIAVSHIKNRNLRIIKARIVRKRKDSIIKSPLPSVTDKAVKSK